MGGGGDKYEDEDKDKDKYKDKDTHTDKDKYNVLPRPYVCYFSKAGGSRISDIILTVFF